MASLSTTILWPTESWGACRQTLMVYFLHWLIVFLLKGHTVSNGPGVTMLSLGFPQSFTGGLKQLSHWGNSAGQAESLMLCKGKDISSLINRLITCTCSEYYQPNHTELHAQTDHTVCTSKQNTHDFGNVQYRYIYKPLPSHMITELMKSESLRNLFYIILLIGNFINGVSGCFPSTYTILSHQRNMLYIDTVYIVHVLRCMYIIL